MVSATTKRTMVLTNLSPGHLVSPKACPNRSRRHRRKPLTTAQADMGEEVHPAEGGAETHAEYVIKAIEEAEETGAAPDTVQGVASIMIESTLKPAMASHPPRYPHKERSLQAHLARHQPRHLGHSYGRLDCLRFHLLLYRLATPKPKIPPQQFLTLVSTSKAGMQPTRRHQYSRIITSEYISNPQQTDTRKSQLLNPGHKPCRRPEPITLPSSLVSRRPPLRLRRLSKCSSQVGKDGTTSRVSGPRIGASNMGMHMVNSKLLALEELGAC